MQNNPSSNHYPTWILITILILYFLVSLIWFGVLYITPNGQNFCYGDNFPCSVAFPLTRQVANLQEQAVASNKQLVQQKIGKNKIKAAFDELAVIDEDMVLEQAKLDKAIKFYQKFYDSSIVFVNKKAQFLPTFTEGNVTKVKDALLVEIDSIKAKLTKKAERKVILKQTVDGIYSDLAERVNNGFAGNNVAGTTTDLVDTQTAPEVVNPLLDGANGPVIQ